jgi:hypothetical protein
MNDMSFRMTVPRAAGGNGVFSTWLNTQLVNHAFVASRSYTPAASLFVALFTIPPTADGGGTEVNTDPLAYRRLPIVFNPAAGIPPVAENAAEIDWPVATEDWGFISAAAIFDATVAGNFLAYGLMLAPDGITPTSKLVQAGDVFLITMGSLTVGLF